MGKTLVVSLWLMFFDEEVLLLTLAPYNHLLSTTKTPKGVKEVKTSLYRQTSSPMLKTLLWKLGDKKARKSVRQIPSAFDIGVENKKEPIILNI